MCSSNTKLLVAQAPPMSTRAVPHLGTILCFQTVVPGPEHQSKVPFHDTQSQPQLALDLHSVTPSAATLQTDIFWAPHAAYHRVNALYRWHHVLAVTFIDCRKHANHSTCIHPTTTSTQAWRSNPHDYRNQQWPHSWVAPLQLDDWVAVPCRCPLPWYQVDTEGRLCANLSTWY